MTSEVDDSSSDASKKTVKKGKSLEFLLLEKNRSLQNETTQLKTQNNELTGKKKWWMSFF